MYNLYIRQTVVFFIGITLSLFISCLFYWFEPYVSTTYEEMRKKQEWIVQQYKELFFSCHKYSTDQPILSYM